MGETIVSLTHILITPDTRFAHRSNEVGAGKQHNADIPALTVLRLDATQDCVNFVIKMIQHNGSSLISLESLP